MKRVEKGATAYKRPEQRPILGPRRRLVPSLPDARRALKNIQREFFLPPRYYQRLKDVIWNRHKQAAEPIKLYVCCA